MSALFANCVAVDLSQYDYVGLSLEGTPVLLFTADEVQVDDGVVPIRHLDMLLIQDEWGAVEYNQTVYVFTEHGCFGASNWKLKEGAS